MKILISNTSDSPLYQQIKDQIKDAILKEELVEGDALPSIRAFANDLKVSVLTIRRVYEELEQEGFITSQVGIGTFVSAGNLELLRDSKRRLVEQKMLDMIQTARLTMKDILRVKNLNKSYKNFSLTDVSFSLSEGCITGFIGINGAGKTTTLRTILNLAKKDSGNIQFFGLDMDKNEQQIKNRIGVVLDDGCFYEELSMAEMKSILASAYTDWSEQDFKHYMDMFSLDPKRKINTLSKGMKMKYALTLALYHNAELLIMDEPTSGLDPLSRSQLLNVLNDYMENGGKGVLFSTHITSDLDKIADMLIMIHNGRIVFQEEKDFLLDNYRIIKGDKKLLTENIRQLFLNITETAFGFTGVTRHAARVQSYLPDAITERPTIEDIMLANLGGCGK